MIVEVIVSNIGKQAAYKCQSGNTTLNNTMRTNLHKAIFATLVYHSTHKCIERNGIGSCMCCCNLLCANEVCNRRKESGFMAELGHQFVQKRCYGSFAICAGNANQFHLSRRVAIESRGYLTESLVSIRNNNNACIGRDNIWCLFANNGATALSKHSRNICM